MKIPKSLEFSPIIDANIELRFETSVFPNAVFGLLYNQFITNYNNVERLPILQIPEQLLETDPNFKFKAHYKLSNNDFIIQIGPNVLSVGSTLPYKGWNIFSDEALNIFNKLIALNIITRFTRIGIRYINFFETNIFDHIEMALMLKGNHIFNKNTLIKTQITSGDVNTTIQISNEAILNKGSNAVQGSVIDIDSFKSYPDDSVSLNVNNEISMIHEIEKHMFFSLLSDDFLSTLNPKYEE